MGAAELDASRSFPDAIGTRLGRGTDEPATFGELGSMVWGTVDTRSLPSKTAVCRERGFNEL